MKVILGFRKEVSTVTFSGRQLVIFWNTERSCPSSGVLRYCSSRGFITVRANASPSDRGMLLMKKFGSV